MHLAIEVGGTSIRMATVPSETPKVENVEALNSIIDNIQSIPFEEFEISLDKILKYCEGSQFSSIGISSFGPICLLKDSPKYGEILAGACAVKKTWMNKSLAKSLAQNLKIDLERVKVETDVNGACLAEIEANKVLNSGEFENVGENWSYITVGTGVGVGLVNTATMRGCFGGVAGHPEGGHIM